MNELKPWEELIGKIVPKKGSLYRVDGVTGDVYAIDPKNPEFIRRRKLGMIARRKKDEERKVLKKQKDDETRKRIEERKVVLASKIEDLEKKYDELG